MWQKLIDDAGVVNAGLIEDRPMTAAEELEPDTAEHEPDEQAAAPPVPPPVQPRTWSMPTVEATRKYTDDFGRIASTFGASVAAYARRIGAVCGRVASFCWQLLREVPPALQLLGALGILTVLGIVGSVALDNSFGRTCAVVFVPILSVAFGAIAHRTYGGAGGERAPRKDIKKNASKTTGATADLQRSVEYVDSKLAFALNALGTERQQQAVIALIQAKTATELSFTTATESVESGPRPRIKDGGAAKTFSAESISAAAGRS
jgi:hypothetical protein